MKKMFLPAFMFFCSVGAFAQTQFALSGKIASDGNTKVRLSYTNVNGASVNDTCVLKDGLFSFTGNISEPSMVFFSIYKGQYHLLRDEDPNKTSFYLEPTTIQVSGSYNHIKELKITGSKTQDEDAELQLQTNPILIESEPIEQQYLRVQNEYNTAHAQKKSINVLDSLNKITDILEKQLEPFNEKYDKVIKKFIAKYPGSYVSVFNLWMYKTRWPIDTVRTFYSNLKPVVQKSNYGKEIYNQLATIDSNSTDMIAKNFITVDVNSKPISLLDFKGKYVLLDFWGSWCIPCRQSTPHLIELFNKYNKLGLEVIAVAEDNDSQSAWKQAIIKDKTNIWHNVLAGNKKDGDGASITKSYSIVAFPTRILIDKNGIIIGRYTGTDDADGMDKKLAEIFK